MLTRRLVSQLILTFILIPITGLGFQQSASTSKGDQPKTESAKSPGPSLSPKEREALEERAKKAKAQYERDLKDAFKRPAVIEIKSPLEIVQSSAIGVFVKQGFRLTKNSKDKLVFERDNLSNMRFIGETPAFRNGFQIVTLKLSVIDQITRIEADIRLDVRSSGGYNRLDINKEPSARRWLTFLLYDIGKATQRQ